MRNQGSNPGRLRRLQRSILALACVLALQLPLPLQAQIPVKSYGQELVDRVAAKNPDLLVIAMHVTPPKSTENVIIASNIGRIGKVADQDDLRVIDTEKSNLEVAHGGTRFEVELVLQDVTGRNIGALGLVFPYKARQDKSALEGKATRIRDQLAKRILDAGSLVEPHPYDPLATTKTHAQKLVDRTLARHPELLVLALHVTPPKGKDSVILASNIGSIGKKSEAIQLKCLDCGDPSSMAGPNDPRFAGVEVPLRDVSGKQLGAISLGFSFAKPHDQKTLLAKAEKIRAQLESFISSLESLMALDP